jgi:tRNA 2-thiouridine synthesizing protein E
MPLIVGGKKISTDKEGFLKNLTDWNEATAQALAEQDNIELTPSHWEIITLVRKFYQQFELSPAMRALVKFTKQELGTDKGNSIYLLKLFPGSPARYCSKIAGLPKPDNCL